MEDEIQHNPASILNLFDYTDKNGIGLTVDKKIDLLQKVIRYLARKDYSSDKDRSRTREAINSYRIELDYLKNQQQRNSFKIDEEDSLRTIAIIMTATSTEQEDVCRKSLQEYVKFKTNDPKRSDRRIYHDEIDKHGDADVKESTFYRWCNNYRKNLDSLKDAQN